MCGTDGVLGFCMRASEQGMYLCCTCSDREERRAKESKMGEGKRACGQERDVKEEGCVETNVVVHAVISLLFMWLILTPVNQKERCVAYFSLPLK